MKKEKLVWRLSKLPSVEELRDLVKDKIVTQEEARDILFSFEAKGDRGEKSLKSEIEFLRAVVEKLSKSRTEIVKIIEEQIPTYKRWSWREPYEWWCNNVYYGNTTTGTLTCNNSSVENSVGATVTLPTPLTLFTSIKTF